MKQTEFEVGRIAAISDGIFAIAGLALGGMWFLSGGHKDNPDAGSMKRVIYLLPVMAVIASLLAFVDTRLGITVWIVWPFLSMMRHRREIPGGN